MYVRRKIFSVLVDEKGEERLFSVNETYLEQREFGAHKRKQNRKAARDAKYIEINANKAAKAEVRAVKALENNNLEAAEKAVANAERHAAQSNISANRLSERADKIAKTRNSIDSKEGLTIKKEGKQSKKELNLKRDISNSQTTATNTVIPKHDVVTSASEKVRKTATTVTDRSLNAPKRTIEDKIKDTKDRVQKAIQNESKKVRKIKSVLNPVAKWSKGTKVGAGIVAGTAVLGTGAYLHNKNKKKENK